ncbi:MAG: septum formation initiator family protein [Clostridia bacterium]|nr:septum formation initiator family protein [Clostridia bacterium]
MKKKISSKKKIYIAFLIAFVIYSCSIFVNQQEKLNSYSKQKDYLQSELQKTKDKQKDLQELKENVNSPEYIEEIARDKLDMYLPNERVYIDMSK